ncbi:hypothetical protein C900_05175 [Fulvivirga imtechensis AK7]|uniref:Uncharacterized protein n=1 Tax=Fulvivirga imtechensis AK7 TaxID=1237149 RepID=L8JK74_9BACT|nr:hypothetical protein C900_05175 [Fulvivirga imtechensis AK7]
MTLPFFVNKMKKNRRQDAQLLHRLLNPALPNFGSSVK